VSEDRTKRGLRDLVLSLAVVGIFVAFLFAVVWRPAPEAVKVVDPTLQLDAARAQARFDVLAPEGLSGDWKPTSARYEASEDGSSTWFLGYVTPDGQYVALAQTDGPEATFVAEQTLDGVAEGQREVAGQQWRQYVSGDQRSLVTGSDGSTTVVTGTASYDELAAFVDRLRS
jgi:hypothetical protein